MKSTLMASAIASLPFTLGTALAADTVTELPGVVITAPQSTDPLTVITDPKQARQPLPAHDGGDYLKSIPGFALIRKGGTDGDPVFRGMAGSRLNILVDGENILGGCNLRMDAPTAYIFPEMFDTLTVVKGPQSVIHGAGSSAGTVMFERDHDTPAAPGRSVQGSLTLGSAGRQDEMLDARVSSGVFYGELTATHSTANDYEDGDGNKVHATYMRYSLQAALGYTPDADTRLELRALQSDGEAAYADRGMDGTKFLRQNLGARFEKRNISSLISKLEGNVYVSQVDHIMDDQELRRPGMMGYANLTRDTQGGRLAATLNLSPADTLVTGLDAQANQHESRSAPASGVYTAWAKDAAFRQLGAFGELTHNIDAKQRLVAGLRVDDWHVRDQRSRVLLVTTMGMAMAANPTRGHSRDDTLTSGFGRWELHAGASTWFAGIGHSERFPDYWELIAKEGVNGGTALSAFDEAKPEKTDQIDIGWTYQHGPLKATVSGFVNRIDDFLLIQSSMRAAPNRMVSITRNISASSYGGEAGLSYKFSDAWMADGTLAYVRGENRTDDTPLAQLPPLEGRLALNYDNKTWAFGALLRLVAKQDRVDIGKGNIVGQDIGKSVGFAVFSINGGYRVNKRLLISAGIDNLFDKTYAEHISRASATGMSAVPGYVQTTRVNEVGRTTWLKAQIALD